MSPAAAAAPTKALKPGPKQRGPKTPKKPRRTIQALTHSQLPAIGPQPELWVQKLTHPVKRYRLIWKVGSRFWLCGEDERVFQSVHGAGGVVEAGNALAEKLGLKLKE
jgi:hypothetical protein